MTDKARKILSFAAVASVAAALVLLLAWAAPAPHINRGPYVVPTRAVDAGVEGRPTRQVLGLVTENPSYPITILDGSLDVSAGAVINVDPNAHAYGVIYGVQNSCYGIIDDSGTPGYFVPAGGVTAVTGTNPIVSSGSTTPVISINPATDTDAGSLSASDKTKLDAIPYPDSGLLSCLAGSCTWTPGEAFYATVVTNDATVTVLWTEPAELASTTYDYIASVMGQNTPTDGGASGNGDIYRADFAWNEQRIASAGPTAAGATPAPLNTRFTGAGNTWGTGTPVTFTVTGNSFVVQVTGLAGTTINWNIQVTRSQVPG